jgi:hypothetical protein
MLGQAFGETLLGKGIVDGFQHDIAGCGEVRQEARLLERIVANHVLARMKLDQKPIKRFAGRGTDALGLLMASDKAFDRMHLITRPTSAVKKVLHSLSHILWTESLRIKGPLGKEVSTQGAKRRGKIFQLGGPVLSQILQESKHAMQMGCQNDIVLVETDAARLDPVNLQQFVEKLSGPLLHIAELSTLVLLQGNIGVIKQNIAYQQPRIRVR